MYQIFKFRKIETANQKAKEIKKQYGYSPRVIKLRKLGEENWKFVVVKPKNIRKI